MKSNVLHIVIIDDHPIVVQGFLFMLQEMPDFKISGTFTNAETGLVFLENNHVDVVLLDINLPDKNGIECCGIIKSLKPNCKVIGISNINEYSIIQRMIQSGASGYLLKNASTKEVLDVINKVVLGELGLSQSVQDLLRRHNSGEIPVITKREKEVLLLLSKGFNSKQIGEKIFISPLTVESHRGNLLQKFKVTNVAALIHQATEMKYI